MSGFRGTSVDQDARYFNREKKEMAALEFPESFKKSVDLSKVQLEVIHQWITDKITAMMGFEDDILIGTAINLMEPKPHESLDPKKMQMDLSGFLAAETPAFMKELWDLLLSAQDSPTGIPEAMLADKKKEIRVKRLEQKKQRTNVTQHIEKIRQAAIESLPEIAKDAVRTNHSQSERRNHHERRQRQYSCSRSRSPRERRRRYYSRSSSRESSRRQRRRRRRYSSSESSSSSSDDDDDARND